MNFQPPSRTLRVAVRWPRRLIWGVAMSVCVALLAAACAGSSSTADPDDNSTTASLPDSTGIDATLPDNDAIPFIDEDTESSIAPDDSSATGGTDTAGGATAGNPGAVGDTTGAGDNPNPNPASFTLGLLLDYTRELAAFNAPLIAAIQLAAAEANAAGYQNVSLLASDTASDIATAQDSADVLINSGADAVIGTSSSALTAEVISRFAAAQIPLVSPASTSLELTDSLDNGYFFRTTPSDIVRSQAVAELILGDFGGGSAVGDDGAAAANIAVIYPDTETGAALAQAVSDRLQARELDGLSVVAEIAVDPAAENFDEMLAELAVSQTTAMALLPFNNASQFLIEWSRDFEVRTAAAAEAGLGDPALQLPPEVSFYFLQRPADPPWSNSGAAGGNGDADGEPEAQELTGIAAIKGIATAIQIDPDSPFAQRFEFFVETTGVACPEDMNDAACEAAGQPGLFTAEAYDAAVLVLLADLRADLLAGGSDGNNDNAATANQLLAESISAVASGGIQCFSYIDCASLLAAGADINYQGASGPLDFSEAGEPEQAAFQAWQLNDLNQLQLNEELIEVN